MSCASCAERIRRAVEALDGVVACIAEYAHGVARVSYDPDRVDRERIEAAIRETGYEVVVPPALGAEPLRPRGLIGGFAPLHLAGIAVVLLGLLLGLRATGLFARIPEVTAGMGYGLLFVIGVLTSLHCVAMCGGINLSQSVSTEGGTVAGRIRPGLLYNAGRVVSYTVVGAVVGALGSLIGFSRTAQGIIVAVAGIFMVVMGITMLDLLPGLRRIVPRMPRAAGRLIGRAAGGGRPFVVGLLNGLMPCGPLQSMQIYALGAGSAAAGALSMLLFSLGTVPLMLGFGAIASLLSRRLHAKVVGVSALLVAFLGVGMVARGMNLTGVSPGLGATVSGLLGRRGGAQGQIATLRDGVQYVQTTLQPSSYEPIVVQAGVPLRWTVEASADSINGCNSPMTVPSYGIEKRLVPGANLIEFVPGEPGDVTYTCWMGMISSVIRIVPDLTAAAPSGFARLAGGGASPSASAASCCGSGQASSAAASCCGDGGTTAAFGGGLIVRGPVSIPTDAMAVAAMAEGVQRLSVESSGDGFVPAVLVMQRGVPALWELRTSAPGEGALRVDIPAYDARLELDGEGAAVRFVPQEDFTLNTTEGGHYAYVKVVDDLRELDEAAIRQEVQDFCARSGDGIVAERLPGVAR